MGSLFSEGKLSVFHALFGKNPPPCSQELLNQLWEEKWKDRKIEFFVKYQIDSALFYFWQSGRSHPVVQQKVLSSIDFVGTAGKESELEIFDEEIEEERMSLPYQPCYVREPPNRGCIDLQGMVNWIHYGILHIVFLDFSNMTHFRRPKGYKNLSLLTISLSKDTLIIPDKYRSPYLSWRGKFSLPQILSVLERLGVASRIRLGLFLTEQLDVPETKIHVTQASYEGKSQTKRICLFLEKMTEH